MTPIDKYTSGSFKKSNIIEGTKISTQRSSSTAFHRGEQGYLISAVQSGGGIRAAAVDERYRFDCCRNPQRGEQIGDGCSLGKGEFSESLAGRCVIPNIGEGMDVHPHSVALICYSNPSCLSFASDGTPSWLHPRSA